MSTPQRRSKRNAKEAVDVELSPKQAGVEEAEQSIPTQAKPKKIKQSNQNPKLLNMCTTAAFNPDICHLTIKHLNFAVGNVLVNRDPQNLSLCMCGQPVYIHPQEAYTLPVAVSMNAPPLSVSADAPGCDRAVPPLVFVPFIRSLFTAIIGPSQGKISLGKDQ